MSLESLFTVSNRTHAVCQATLFFSSEVQHNFCNKLFIQLKHNTILQLQNNILVSSQSATWSYFRY